MRVAIVAGEVSGDILGAGLIKELRAINADIEFIGIGGALMQQQGFVSSAEMDKLSIMGFDGLLENLSDILAIRKNLIAELSQNPPDVFIGIDAPDFNLTVERKLRAQGVPAVHYVSPSVWAWRGGRIKKIRRSVDLMLSLFPFEEVFYKDKNIPVKFVGHPLAKKLKPNDDAYVLPQVLKEIKAANKKLIAVLPGSRRGEVKRLGELFFASIQDIKSRVPNTEFVIPVANKKVAKLIDELLDQNKELKGNVHLVSGEYSSDAMRAADVVLLASGTAALESAMLAKPTVVAYKLSLLTYWYAKLSFTAKYVSLPNHLLDEALVPEYIQENATVENLAGTVVGYLEDKSLYKATQEKLQTIHPMLNYDADKKAAAAVLQLLEDRK